MTGNTAMAFTPTRNDVSVEELEARYADITALYDLAGELVETVESDFARTSEEQWSIVEPLINEIGDATDVLTEEFMHIAEARVALMMHQMAQQQ